MSFQFATCERGRALGFLARLYPSYTLEDSPESIGPLLDLIEADVCRVLDPMMHNPSQLVPGKNWSGDRTEEVLKACKALTLKPKRETE